MKGSKALAFILHTLIILRTYYVLKVLCWGIVMKKIIILTSNELRHSFMRKAIALDSEIEVLKSYCELKNTQAYTYTNAQDLQEKHLALRLQSEKDFFQAFVDLSPDLSKPHFIPDKAINNQEFIDEIIDLKPDLLIAYGCSLIEAPLIDFFGKAFLNVHLGLSPYYRGSGTNFFPLVNNEPEFVGASFMYIDKGIDTGDIIHQIRAEVCINDDCHKIGNRLIAKVASTYKDLIKNYENLVPLKQPNDKKSGKLYKKKDFTLEATLKMYDNFANNLVEKYLQKPESQKASILENPALTKDKQ
ncbi:hypothetical protein CQA38_08670 [Campylobacter sp. MIT 12-5580]|nr:hypothetical protein CQA38_08670 [Campylobacter sp. MIT 12-5580]